MMTTPPDDRPMRRLSPEERMAILREILSTSPDPLPGPCAARSQDFLYDENGLPA